MSGSNEGGSQPELTPEVQTLIGDARKKVRDELLTRFSVAFVAGGVGILALAALGGWFILKPILVTEVGGSPRGAVVAFDRDDLDESHCPEGWSPFLYARARAIVGAGNPEQAPEKMAYDQNGKPLKGYVLRQHGGEQEHTLTISEMPSHTHDYLTFTGGTEANGGSDPKNLLNGPRATQTGAAGGSQPHNVTSPFIALYYCKKDG